ncbi:dienelactone hydrolase family protein [Photobacterium rosenbergii]|uniref:Dienelactone hydrolase family protein n=1 Tax=Photobacterium rosenbergii TaxID=294936 RepID=A0ABU3ZIC8_9GAMM|nr:dienelactone hydrolase family protein [Photobacterium rosenbergii]MDV5169704.1 dienelactone hydrolase family protein [Photobacterium rosenbergii]
MRIQLHPLLLACVSIFLLSGYAHGTAPQQTYKHSYVAFQTGEEKPRTVAARFSKPKQAVLPLPTIIIVHGSGGVDARGTTYSKAFNQSGMATLEIDMWAARGLEGGLSRPKHVRDTLPDIYAAIEYLKSRQDVDSEKLGLIGFSWGGVVAMLMSGAKESQAITALVANYPVCWAYNKVPGYPFKEVAGQKQLLIVSGEEDQYDGPQDCINLVEQLPPESRANTTLKVLPNATHAFDLIQQDSTFYDPYAFRGEGGHVPLKYNQEATKLSTMLSTSFFLEHFEHSL